MRVASTGNSNKRTLAASNDYLESARDRKDSIGIAAAVSFLSSPRSPRGDRFATDPPVVGIHLVDHHHRGSRILVQHLAQQFGHAGDQPGFLLRRGAFSGDLDIDVRHVVFLQTAI